MKERYEYGEPGLGLLRHCHGEAVPKVSYLVGFKHGGPHWMWFQFEIWMTAKATAGPARGCLFCGSLCHLVDMVFPRDCLCPF
jgi:hypothetical protein